MKGFANKKQPKVGKDRSKASKSKRLEGREMR
jgi:hypothetical protein